MYEGEFKDNMMEGFGFYLFADGKTYEGFYLNDKKHGYGVYTWVSSKKYSGWWSNGKQDGLGMLIKKDGNKIKYGLWIEGKKQEWLNNEQIQKFREDYNAAVAKENGESEDQLSRMTF